MGSAVSAMRPPMKRGAMNARWRAAVSGSSRADECTSVSIYALSCANRLTSLQTRPSDALPKSAGLCGSPLKRTLSVAPLSASAAPDPRATALSSPNSSVMVNDALPNGGRRMAAPTIRVRRPPSRARESHSRSRRPTCLGFFNDENRSNFRKSLGQLDSNMRKINGTERTSPSSDSASFTSTAGKTPWRTRGRVMFFLLRTAFWLSIVIALLPAPESMKPESAVGAAQAVSAASATFSDMSQFCARQPDACQIGSQALSHFGHKAQASAKWLYDMLASKSAATQTPAEPAKAVADGDSQNTLTQADTMPAWRGTGQHQADLKRPQ